MKPVLRYVCIFALICICNAYQSPSEVILPLIDIPPEVITGIQPTTIITATGQINSGVRIMFELFNSKSCDFQGLLNNTKIRARTFPTLNSGPAAIRHTIALAEQGFSLIGGVATFQIASPSSQVGTVYDIATLSSFAPESQLSNKNMYPYFSRTAPSISDMVRAEIAAILNFSEQSGPGWTDIAIISELSEYGTDFCQTVIEQGHEAGLTVKQYRTFLAGTSYRNDLITIKNSGARLIICDLSLEDFRKFLRTAEEEGLIGDSYVWFISPATTGTTFPAGSGSFPLARGIITAFLPYPEPDPFFLCYAQAWKEANTTIYPFAGTERLPLPALPAADFAMAIIAAYDAMDKMEMLDGRISAQMWADVIRNVSVTGINQVIEFLPSGDRLIGVSLFYYSDQTDSFVKFADTRIADGQGNLKLDFVGDVVWFSNTTDIPDLDIRPPFFYWSCKDGEKREDVTGKTISRQVPDGSDIDEIDIDYHCDYFIDCRNFSDESADCSSDYLALFIVFGIITGLLMFLTVALMIFVFIFGIILKYRRLKTASPFFLLLLLFTILVGYSSIFAFFGKPHPVACAFQPWLLGLPTISMIAVLSVKNFRIYRIFRYPLKKTTITDWELLIWWTIVLIPAVIIIVLWMIISTPTADMETRSDNDHYVCTTGGFTGKPGGLVFFFIFVAYSALILLFGCVISVLSRNVPSLFNESKLLTISIYNLGFLAAVIIPVFLVVQPINPFLAWIFRTCAVLYAFTATMVLQFLPKVFGIVVLDKLTDKKVTSYVQTSTATLQ